MIRFCQRNAGMSTQGFLFIPLFTHCRIVRRNSKYSPSLLTSGLNRTTVYAVALIKQCLIPKLTAGSYWVELIWY